MTRSLAQPFCMAHQGLEQRHRHGTLTRADPSTLPPKGKSTFPRRGGEVQPRSFARKRLNVRLMAPPGADVRSGEER